MVLKGVRVPMGAIIITHISTSSNDLLFMHMKSGLFEDFLVLKKLARLQVPATGRDELRQRSFVAASYAFLKRSGL